MSSDISRLKEILGEKGLLDDPADMAAYCTDLLGETASPVLAVARPDNTDNVAEVVKWCRAAGIMIVPQGGLTGLVNGAIPNQADPVIILSLGRMNQIHPVDTLNNSVVVEAGAILANVKAAAEAADRYFPLTHGGEGSSQIGGNLSTNSGGNNALRYGTARDQVLGLEVVLPDGTIWSGLRGLRKNTAGYDLKHLFIGAEGTLGIITQACLKVLPLPRTRETAFLAVDSPTAALAMLRRMESEAGELVCAYELLSAAALSRAMTIEGTRYPFDQEYDWLVLVELESASQWFDLQGALEKAVEFGLEEGLIVDAVAAMSIQQRIDFWRLREAIAEALIDEPDSLKSDTAVPVASVPNFLETAEAAVQEAVPGAVCVPFGHLGDGNVHFNVRRPDDMAPEQFRKCWDQLAHAIEMASLKFAGTISAEHGIGRLKQRDFDAVTSAEELALIARLKLAMDPHQTMNAGVLINDDDVVGPT